jgi:hypothetical protein
MAKAGPSTAATCGVSGTFFEIPRNVTLLAELSGNQLGALFHVIGVFTVTPPACGYACGEYRQFVRGVLTHNGRAITHSLCGTNLDPTTFHEDCVHEGGKALKYGYRSIPFGSSSFTNPDQATGRQFEGFDEPKIRGVPGDQLGMNLNFRGELIDTCSGSKLDSAEWSVSGAAIVP